MVVFVDLEGEDDELQDIQHSLSHQALTSRHLQKLKVEDEQSQQKSADDHYSNEQGAALPAVEERPNPNINGFSATLSCYP
jgi:hypothetical protein